MTFSITGHCPRTGQIGVAITTSSIAVGSRCPWVRSSKGAVATQNVTMPSIGNDILDLMEKGQDANTALETVMAGEKHPEYRQVAVVDHNGNCALFSGGNTLGRHATATGIGCIAAGNLLADEKLPSVMISKFESNSNLELTERLLCALESGLNEGGGEAGPVHSAALLVAGDFPWPIVDLRVDWSDNCPVAELRELWGAYAPQMRDFINRAINPTVAPSYGVPGDE